MTDWLNIARDIVAPHARDNPPWSGVHTSDGLAYAVPGAGNAVAIFADPFQSEHLLTLFDGRALGDEIEIAGRRFDVVRMSA